MDFDLTGHINFRKKNNSCLIVVQFSKISLIIMTDCKNFDCITERCIPNKTQTITNIFLNTLLNVEPKKL